jgi:hypothetical protein
VNFKLPVVTEMTGPSPFTAFFHWDGVSAGCPGARVFLISTSCVAWGDRHAPLCPAISWNGVLSPRHPLASNQDPDFSLPSSKGYRCEPLAPSLIYSVFLKSWVRVSLGTFFFNDHF